MAEKTALFAAGCFWGVEAKFRQMDGVTDTAVGYAGGQTEEPSYEDVCTGTTDHAEVVQVAYDPEVTDFETLLRAFFELHDPTQKNRQGPDIGTQYRSAVFVADEAERETTQRVIAELNDSGRFGQPIATTVEDDAPFWRGEEYHQQYLAKRGLATCGI